MNKFRQLWSNLRSSFWFIPSLIVVFSTALAVALIEADSAGSDRWLAQWPRLFGAGAEGTRGMMSTIAGSMMTVVGVTFSMILVVLALASSQYTSRILRNFMRSRITQVVLGIFAIKCNGSPNWPSAPSSPPMTVRGSTRGWRACAKRSKSRLLCAQGRRRNSIAKLGTSRNFNI